MIRRFEHANHSLVAREQVRHAARRDGVAVPGRLRAGAALVARGEFSIVIAGLAVAAGVVDVGPVAAGYVLVVAVLGPVLARFVEPLTAAGVARWAPPSRDLRASPG